MPHPSVYVFGTQDDDLTRSIDVVHIEPSIREGLHLVPSLYGKGASAPLFRFAPVNTFPPYITGDPKIPNILTVHDGQWAASPSAVLYYQWMSDGIDIPGANQSTWLSTPAYDNTQITVEVKGVNPLGESYVLTSNSIGISTIEPIDIKALEYFFITGLPQGLKTQTVRSEKNTIISGIGAKNRLDINRTDMYYITGSYAVNRSDIMGINYHFITGLQQNDTLSVLERDISLAVISWDIGEPLIDGEPQHFNICNPTAEMGLHGWTSFGGATYTKFNLHSSPFAFYGGENASAATGNTPYRTLTQDVPVFDIWFSDVDAGTTSLLLSWYQYSIDGQDEANVKVEYYAANDSLLGSENLGLIGTPAGTQTRREINDAIPSGTRYIRVIQEFNLIAGADINANIDSISMQIYKETLP